jgi:uncharacterized protein (DUF2147 family)
MRIKTFALSIATFAAGCAVSQAAQAASDAKGVWMNDTGRGAIEIKDCGGKLCGHVVWTRDEGDASRGCGKQIIGDAQSVGGGVWDNGWVYSPDKKRRYDVELKPLSDGTLRVKGYAGTKFFSKTMIWTPAPADLKRCDATNVEARVAPQAAPAKPAETASIEKAQVTAPALAAPAPSAKAPAASASQALAAAASAKTEAPAKSVVEPQATETKPAAAPAPEQAQQTQSEPQVADADSVADEMPKDLDELVDKLDGKEFGNGYGLKKMGNGDCRVKLPYVNITVPCKK